MKEILKLNQVQEILNNYKIIQWDSSENDSVFIDDLGISIVISNDEETFYFRRGIPKTVFFISSGKFLPVTNEKQFRKFYLKFRETVEEYFIMR